MNRATMIIKDLERIDYRFRVVKEYRKKRIEVIDEDVIEKHLLTPRVGSMIKELLEDHKQDGINYLEVRARRYLAKIRKELEK